MDFVTQVLEQNELNQSLSTHYSDRFENEDFILDGGFDYEMIGFGRSEELDEDPELYNELEEINF